MSARLHVVLLCATHRGIRTLDALRELAPDARLDVVSFRKEPIEPPYLEELGTKAREIGAEMHERKELDGNDPPTWLEHFDLLFAVNWRYRVPSAVYRRGRLGAFVFHDSLLPEYRGSSPTVWAIVNGEDHTGVTLIEMTETLDGGDIVDQMRVPIAPTDTIRDVMDRVTQGYIEIMQRTFPLLLSRRAHRTPQDASAATYACKRLPEDNLIDWTAPTRRIVDLIRGVTRPYPGAFTFFDDRRLTIWSAHEGGVSPKYVGRVPGRIVERCADGTVIVLTGDGSLSLDEVQIEGGGPGRAAEVITSLRSTLGR